MKHYIGTPFTLVYNLDLIYMKNDYIMASGFKALKLPIPGRFQVCGADLDREELQDPLQGPFWLSQGSV